MDHEKDEHYVEAGWSKADIREAVELLNTCQTVLYFKGEYWDHRMLRHAVESEMGRLESEFLSLGINFISGG